MKFVLLIVALFFVHTIQAKSVSLNVVNNNGEGFSGVVVYLTPNDLSIELPKNENSLIIGQENRAFSPYISVVQKGQEVDFENNDDITHHIYSVSGQNTFDFKIKAGKRITLNEFNASEEVAMGCNIHDWMSGYLLVVDTPYFGLTNEKGSISFDLIHEGDYTVKVWHPQLDTTNNQYEVLMNFNLERTPAVEHQIKVPAILLEVPLQKSTEDFDFLDEY